MPGEPKYPRVLVKLSGESLGGADGAGIDPAAAASVAAELAGLAKMGVELGVVVGGGNLMRARAVAGQTTLGRVTADVTGMLGTVMNALALRDALAAAGLDARVMSAIAMPSVCETFDHARALRHLAGGRVVVFAGGTGSPFFTTDTTAALRAAETGCRLLIKATKVDGVYDADPVATPSARRFDRLTYDEVVARRLGVMDLTAVTLCADNDIPIVVCRLATAGSLARAARGEAVGTLVGR